MYILGITFLHFERKIDILRRRTQNQTRTATFEDLTIVD